MPTAQWWCQWWTEAVPDLIADECSTGGWSEYETEL